MSPFVGGTSLRLRPAKTLCIPPIRGVGNVTPEGVTRREAWRKSREISTDFAPFVTYYTSVKKPPNGRLARREFWESSAIRVTKVSVLGYNARI